MTRVRAALAAGALLTLTACSGGSQSTASSMSPTASGSTDTVNTSPSPGTAGSAPASATTSTTPTSTTSTTPTSTTPTTTISPTTSASAPVPTAVPADLTGFYQQKPTWRGCSGAGGSGDAALQCATIQVPLDYADPAGGTIKLALDRVRAAGPGPKIGSLLVNPGGPGGSGLDYARAADQIVGSDIRARYDIVGFDPRGVGQSTPVKCLSDSQLDTFIDAEPAPDTPAEVARTQQLAKTLAAGCEQESARLLPHVGTVDAARDMDVIRAVVGDTQLHYLGKSYGTFLGATYAGLFPTRVGRMVLDGAIDPTLTSEQLDLGQAQGFQTALESFLADWVKRGDSPLGSTVAQAQQKLGQLLEQINAHPVPTGTARDLTSGQAFLGVVAPLYDRQAWPALRAAITELTKGRGDTLLQFSDLYSDRGPNGYTSNANEVIYAVNCLDRPDNAGPAQVQSQLSEFTKASPVFGSALAWSSLPCADWPVPATGKPGPITAPGAPPILVVGTTRDPATPYRWAQSLARQLQSGVLLTRVGDGHTAYLEGNACIDAKVEAYLLRGTPPADGTRCAAPA